MAIAPAVAPMARAAGAAASRAIPAARQAVKAAGARVAALWNKISPDTKKRAADFIQFSTGIAAGGIAADQLEKLIGDDPRMLKVVSDALVSAGVPPDQIIDNALAQRSDEMNQIRMGLIALAGELRGQAEEGQNNLFGAKSADDVAADMLRRRAVQTALEVYGSRERYLMCHPMGGIPQSDFAWYEQVIRG